jgi:ubiquinone/menaquinone biosynthesis C-methylase UbiE
VYDFLSWISGYQRTVEYFVSELPFGVGENIRVLDVGCGTGPYTFAILKRFKNAEMTAFDLDENLVNTVKEKASKMGLSDRVRVFHADLAGPLSEVTNETFDLIITAGVLVYVPYEATVKNLARFLASGGYFFNSPNRDSLWGRLVCTLYACKPYPRAENLTVFEQNGFVLVKDIKVPNTPTASFKDAHIFRKK